MQMVGELKARTTGLGAYWHTVYVLEPRAVECLNFYYYYLLTCMRRVRCERCYAHFTSTERRKYKLQISTAHMTRCQSLYIHITSAPIYWHITVRAKMAAVRILLLLTCLRVARSDDIVNIVELEPGQLVSNNVSLRSRDTYSIATCSTCSTMVRNVKHCRVHLVYNVAV